MGRLANKVAIVTGGARGMGEQTCRLFAQEGARVVIADVLEAEGEALARELGDAACFMRLDVSDEANWESLVAATLRKFE
jgi:3alpha(or 20beta)-hydroxysteroid dehydrogenase